MYKIMGKYDGTTEEIDVADEWSEAIYMVDEYTMAFGSDWEIWVEEA